MKKVTLLFTIVVFSGSYTTAQQDSLAAEYFRLAEPGLEHEMLAGWEGDWIVTYSMRAPESDSVISYSGPLEIDMVLDGRFQKWFATGNAFGNDFETITYLGFDRRLNVFTLYTMDTFGTYAVQLNGKYDSTANAIVYTGSVYDISVQGDLPVQIIISELNENELAMDILMQFPGSSEWVTFMHQSIKRD